MIRRLFCRVVPRMATMFLIILPDKYQHRLLFFTVAKTRCPTFPTFWTISENLYFVLTLWASFFSLYSYFVEYEHLQFLWGAGKDKVIFPAILGLLHEYSEAWFETRDEETQSGSDVHVKTVDWIPEALIKEVTLLGKEQRGHDGSAHISVKAALGIMEVID